MISGREEEEELLREVLGKRGSERDEEREKANIKVVRG